MNKKQIYNDGDMHSDYFIQDGIVVISQATCDEKNFNFIALEIEYLRNIVADYDLNCGGVNE